MNKSMKKLNKKKGFAFATEKALTKDWDTEEEDNVWKNL